MGETVSLLREPDAAVPPVRFDERDVETEHGTATEAPADERAGDDRPHLNHRAASRIYYRKGVEQREHVRICTASLRRLGSEAHQ